MKEIGIVNFKVSLKNTYDILLNFLANELESIMTGFEMTFRKCYPKNWPCNKQHECYFHLMKAIFGEKNTNNFRHTLYKENAHFSSKVRYFAFSDFVPLVTLMKEILNLDFYFALPNILWWHLSGDRKT